MKTWYFDGVYSGSRWIERPFISVDDDGTITAISNQKNSDNVEKVSGWLLPGFANSHSHAFQFAMAGFAEHGGSEKNDNFWSWRESMYSVALTLTPNQMEAVAQMAYGEMVRAGYTSVTEFHYLHHDMNGSPYADPLEMCTRLVFAAERTGIELTLIPVFYKYGNFGTAATPRQRRFLFKSTDQYFKLVESCAKKWPHVKVGCGVHSLRAASPEETREIFAAAYGVKHIHVAEQPREVEDCLAALGKRPIEWLLENVELDSTCNLVHATHSTDVELKGIAQSGANVVICPSTEANLGDGHFNFRKYFDDRGRWSIGTDSQISFSPIEDLRWLEYQQRLLSRTRNPLCRTETDDSGKILFDECQRGSAAGLGWGKARTLEVGDPLNGFVVDSENPFLAFNYPERRLSALIFAMDPRHMVGTLIRGEWRARAGKHVEQAALLADFRESFGGR